MNQRGHAVGGTRGRGSRVLPIGKDGAYRVSKAEIGQKLGGAAVVEVVEKERGTEASEGLGGLLARAPFNPQEDPEEDG